MSTDYTTEDSKNNILKRLYCSETAVREGEKEGREALASGHSRGEGLDASAVHTEHSESYTTSKRADAHPPIRLTGIRLPLILSKLEQNGMLYFSHTEGADSSAEETVTSICKHLDSISEVGSEFLTFQAEMLVESRTKIGLNASAEGLVLTKDPMLDKDGVRIDYYYSDEQTIFLCPEEPLTPIERTLAHEMTHAIDDIYDDRRSGNRVIEILREHDTEFQKKVVDLAAGIIGDEGLKKVFKEGYCSEVKKSTKSITELCDSVENKSDTGEAQTDAEIEASRLIIEFTAFAMETIFHELDLEGKEKPVERHESFLRKFGTMTTGPVTSTEEAHAPEERRGAATTTSHEVSGGGGGGGSGGGASEEKEELGEEKRVAQGLVAVSLCIVVDEMRQHIEGRARNKNRDKILGKLTEIKTEIDRVIERDGLERIFAEKQASEKERDVGREDAGRGGGASGGESKKRSKRRRVTHRIHSESETLAPIQERDDVSVVVTGLKRALSCPALRRSITPPPRRITRSPSYSSGLKRG